METKTLKQLPVGIQTFSEVINRNCLYVDKTAYIQKMLELSKYIFLSRPRRFGKSLLVSTLQSYFEGRKDLFKGLYIEQVEKDWTEYPVLRLSLASSKHMEKEQLEDYLLHILEEHERRFGISANHSEPNIRLMNLITSVYEKTGKQVVILIDEYDAPLLDVLHEKEKLPVLRQVMRNFYSPLKDADPYLKFVFLTGITKFSQLSIFSELNNLVNISMDTEFASICGFTEEEVRTQMADYVDRMAEGKGWDKEKTLWELKNKYDGYHFTWPSPDVYNPFSLLLAFSKKKLDNYWFESGTTTFLVEMLRKYDTEFTDLKKIEASAYDFDAPTESATSIVPLLYQSGYITIKDYDPDFDFYTLDIPNKEVRIGLTRSLIPAYITPDTLIVNNAARHVAQCLVKEDINGALTILQKFLSTIPYCNNANSEGHYQQVFYIIFTLVTGYFADVEVRTATGRVDMVLQTAQRLYLFELKLNHSAEAAMQQINLKDYPARFARCGLPIVKVGINFDAESHTISDWEIESEC
ncbi:MAG: AAA family ATPase [Alloprevotella sp.]